MSVKSRRKSGDEYVIPGTGLAGAMRGRAWQILNAQLNNDTATSLVNEMFGTPEGVKPLVQSRLFVEETVVPTGNTSRHGPLVQANIAIDSWTGGVYGSSLRFSEALFSSDPSVPVNDDSALEVRMRLIEPSIPTRGLLLQLLKDLWTSDLPIGGQAGSRGALVGVSARLWESGASRPLQLKAASDGLEGDLDELEKMAEGFGELLKGIEP